MCIRDSLVHTPVSGSYELGGYYSIAPAMQPRTLVDGGAVNIDLPVAAPAVQHFDVDPVEVVAVSPAMITAGELTTFTVSGSNLDNVVDLRLGNISLSSGQWSTDLAGGALTFSATLSSPGTYSLTVEQPDESTTLAAAVTVVDSLAISSVSSANPAGASLVSDSGGDLIRVTGQAFGPGIDVHWYQAEQGIEPSSKNAVEYQFDNGNIVFTSPASLIGQDYQVTLVRPATNDRVEAGGQQRLSVIDDTAPTIEAIQSLGYSDALILEAGEPIEAASPRAFTVTRSRKDYSGLMPDDISTRFADLRKVDSRLILELLPGQVLEHNAHYDIVIDGLQDVAGNEALSTSSIVGGQFTGEFVAHDTLAPLSESIQLTLSSGEVVSAATELTQGGSYQLLPSAEDNYVSNGKLSFSYRLSANGGLSWLNDWTVAKSERDSPVWIPLSLGSTFSNSVTLLVRVSDGQRKSQKRFDIQVSQPSINLAEPGFVIAPDPVEELDDSTLTFNLQGNLELISQARVQIAEGSWQDAAFDANTGQVNLAYRQPRLSDLSLDGNAHTMPVTLRVAYGVSGDTQFLHFPASYQLLADQTPPQLSLVAPADGSYIPRGEDVEILVRATDRLGIDRVELCLDAADPANPFMDAQACQILPDPSVHVLSVSKDRSEPLVVQARSRDLGGLYSDTQTLTLYPFEGDGPVRDLDLLLPASGKTVYGGEAVSVLARLNNIESATLALRVDEDPDHQANPAPVILTGEMEETTYANASLTIPDLTEATVIALTLSATVDGRDYNAVRYLNLSPDDGLSGTAIMRIMPDQNVLSGTEVWAKAAAPGQMADFSEESSLRLLEGSVEVADWPMDGVERRYLTTEQSQPLEFEAALRDRSGNSANKTQLLASQNYFVGGWTGHYQPAVGMTPDALVHVPGLNEGVVWAENHADGGYALRSSTTVFVSEDSGRVQSLRFDGRGLVVEFKRGGDLWLRYLPVNGNGFANGIERRIAGEVLAANGGLVYLAYGNTLAALVATGDGFQELNGLTLNEPVVVTAQRAQQLFVLAGDTLTIVEPSVDGSPALQVVSSSTFPQAEQMVRVEGNLWALRDGELWSYPLNGAGEPDEGVQQAVLRGDVMTLSLIHI